MFSQSVSHSLTHGSLTYKFHCTHSVTNSLTQSVLPSVPRSVGRSVGQSIIQSVGYIIDILEPYFVVKRIRHVSVRRNTVLLLLLDSVSVGSQSVFSSSLSASHSVSVTLPARLMTCSLTVSRANQPRQRG